MAAAGPGSKRLDAERGSVQPALINALALPIYPKALVPRAGVEPARPCGHRFLRPTRLPVPPPRRRPAWARPYYRPVRGGLIAVLILVLDRLRATAGRPARRSRRTRRGRPAPRPDPHLRPARHATDPARHEPARLRLHRRVAAARPASRNAITAGRASRPATTASSSSSTPSCPTFTVKRQAKPVFTQGGSGQTVTLSGTAGILVIGPLGDRRHHLHGLDRLVHSRLPSPQRGAPDPGLRRLRLVGARPELGARACGCSRSSDPSRLVVDLPDIQQNLGRRWPIQPPPPLTALQSRSKPRRRPPPAKAKAASVAAADAAAGLRSSSWSWPRCWCWAAATGSWSSRLRRGQRRPRPWSSTAAGRGRAQRQRLHAGAQALNAGNSVATQAKGHAAIQFPDGSFVRMSPDTTVTGQAASSCSKNGQPAVGDAPAEDRTHARVVQHLIGGATFKVGGHSVSAQVRGTEFEMLVRRRRQQPDQGVRRHREGERQDDRSRSAKGQEIDADNNGNSLRAPRRSDRDMQDPYQLVARVSRAVSGGGNSAGTLQIIDRENLATGQTAEVDYQLGGGIAQRRALLPRQLHDAVGHRPERRRARLAAERRRRWSATSTVRRACGGRSCARSTFPAVSPGRSRAPTNAVCGGEKVDTGTMVREILSNAQLSSGLANSGAPASPSRSRASRATRRASTTTRTSAASRCRGRSTSTPPRPTSAPC